jgi:hypothetical protein
MVEHEDVDDLTDPQSIKAYITCAAFMTTVTCTMVALFCAFMHDTAGYLEFGVLAAVLGAGFVSMFLDLSRSNPT